MKQEHEINGLIEFLVLVIFAEFSLVEKLSVYKVIELFFLQPNLK